MSSREERKVGLIPNLQHNVAFPRHPRASDRHLCKWLDELRASSKQEEPTYFAFLKIPKDTLNTPDGIPR